MPFFDEAELASARADMEAELGPHTLRVLQVTHTESETGGPDTSEEYLVGESLEPLDIPFRARLLRTPRTRREGEAIVVVADWEVGLPASYIGQVKRGDRLEASSGTWLVVAIDNRDDALLCRIEALKLEET